MKCHKKMKNKKIKAWSIWQAGKAGDLTWPVTVTLINARSHSCLQTFCSSLKSFWILFLIIKTWWRMLNLKLLQAHRWRLVDCCWVETSYRGGAWHPLSVLHASEHSSESQIMWNTVHRKLKAVIYGFNKATSEHPLWSCTASGNKSMPVSE